MDSKLIKTTAGAPTVKAIAERHRHITHVRLDASREEVAATTGTTDPDVAEALFMQAVKVCPVTDKTGPELVAEVETRTNVAMGIMHGIGPRDMVEGLLAAQLTGLHNLSMSMMKRAARCETPESQESAARQVAKVQGAFLATAEGLKRWRGGGTVQRVVVERVEVAAGGQAIVGAVAGGGGRAPE